MFKRNLLLIISLFIYGDAVYACATPTRLRTTDSDQVDLYYNSKYFSSDSAKSASIVQSNDSHRNKIFGGPFECFGDEAGNDADDEADVSASSDYDEELTKIDKIKPLQFSSTLNGGYPRNPLPNNSLPPCTRYESSSTSATDEPRRALEQRLQAMNTRNLKLQITNNLNDSEVTDTHSLTSSSKN